VKRGPHEPWCIPSVDADFVAAMEDVLDLYAQPYDPITPLVCFDEKPLVVHGQVREPLPVKPGYPQRSDCEYERLGTANLFVFVEPLAGRRAVELTEQRTKLDCAQTIRCLVDSVSPQARVIRLVMDNLNTHTAASLYEAFTPSEAQRNGPRTERNIQRCRIHWRFTCADAQAQMHDLYPSPKFKLD
jgi:hypothetical protein